MDERSLTEALRRIEERVEELERRLRGLTPQAPSVPSEPWEEPGSRTLENLREEMPAAAPPPLPSASVGDFHFEPAPAEAHAAGPRRGGDGDAIVTARPRYERDGRAPPPPPSFANQSVALSESVLGGRVAAWVGALLVMIGVGVFVKYAYDNLWLARLGAGGRYALATAGAAVLLVMGEVALRRMGRAAAAGLSSAGVGSLFVIAAAGTAPHVMQIYGASGAALASLAALGVGLFVSRRSDLLAVGIVSIVGAYLVPLFTGLLDLSSPLGAPLYLTVVLLTAILLARISPAQRAVRWVGMRLHLLLAAILLVSGAVGADWKQGFVAIWWGIFLLDSCWGIVRKLRAAGGRESAVPPRTPETPGAEPVAAETPRTFEAWKRRAKGQSDSAMLTITTLASIVASFSFVKFWSGWSDPWAWLPVGQAILCVAAALQFHAMRGAKGLVPVVDDFVRTLFTLSAALAVAAVALLLQADAACVAWSVMGVGTFAVAVRSRSRSLVWSGILAIAPAACVSCWLALEGRLGGPGVLAELPIPLLRDAVVVISQDVWLPALVALAALIGIRILTRSPERAARGVLVVAATSCWAVVSVAANQGQSGLLVGLVLAVGLAVVARVRGDALERSNAVAVAILLATACLAVVLFTLDRSGSRSGVEPITFLVAIGLIVAGSVTRGEPGTPGPEAKTPPALGRIEDPLTVTALVFLATGFVLELVIAMNRGRDLVERRVVGEVETLAALAAIVAIAGLATAPARGAPAIGDRHSVWRAIAIWSALAWFWGSFVLCIGRGVDLAPPMANFMNATAAVVLGALAVSLWRSRTTVVACVFAGVALVAGSWDLARLAPHLAAGEADIGTLRQALLSGWWAALAVVAVIVGFSWRMKALRWLALALLAVTAAKVLLVDLHRAATLARVGALLAVGLLLVGTSIVYARAERRLRIGREPAGS